MSVTTNSPPADGGNKSTQPRIHNALNLSLTSGKVRLKVNPLKGINNHDSVYLSISSSTRLSDCKKALIWSQTAELSSTKPSPRPFQQFAYLVFFSLPLFHEAANGEEPPQSHLLELVTSSERSQVSWWSFHTVTLFVRTACSWQIYTHPIFLPLPDDGVTRTPGDVQSLGNPFLSIPRDVLFSNIFSELLGVFFYLHGVMAARNTD